MCIYMYICKLQMYTYIHMYIATSISICMPVAHITPHVKRTDVGADVLRVGAYMCVCFCM